MSASFRRIYPSALAMVSAEYLIFEHGRARPYKRHVLRASVDGRLGRTVVRMTRWNR